MKKDKMVFHYTSPYGLTAHGWTYKITEYEVTVMAIVDNYAMVRRPRCMPFVANIKNLRPINSGEKKNG